MNLRFFFGLVGFAILATAVYLQVSYSIQPSTSPINQVKVIGEVNYTSRDELMEKITPYAAWGFFKVDVDAIRAGLETLPWVSGAQVRRTWPDRLVVVIDEHTPLVRWNDNALVTTDYSVIEPALTADQSLAEAFPALPQIKGRIGRHTALLQHYQHIDAQLSQHGDRVTVLSEDERRSLRLSLASGMEVNLGRKHWSERIAKLNQVYGHIIAPEVNKIISIDLRYPNGFAIRYREGQ